MFEDVHDLVDSRRIVFHRGAVTLKALVSCGCVQESHLKPVSPSRQCHKALLETGMQGE